MKIIRTDSELQTPALDQALRDMGHDLLLLPDGVGEDGLITALQGADLLLMCYTPVTRRAIESAPNLRGIVKYGVGIDAIDLAAAREHGVTVVNIPEYAEETVAEGAFALMIALARKLPALDRQMKSEGWAWPEPAWLGHDIAGKTVGIIGMGRIGRSMARICGQGFRARVITYSPHTPKEDLPAGVEQCETLAGLLAQSDFVSVHCVLNNETHHLLGRAELAMMKPSAYLINVARGAIIDEAALLCALKENHIAGAGLDVFSHEPLNRDDHPLRALYTHENVILMPHLTFYTHEAMQRLESETLERCTELLEGRDVRIKSADPRLRAQTKGVIFNSP